MTRRYPPCEQGCLFAPEYSQMIDKTNAPTARSVLTHGDSLSPLTAVLSSLAAGSVEVCDLTAPLSAETPTLVLPEPFANLIDFSIGEWLSSNPSRPLVIDAKIANDSGSWWLAEAFKGH